MVHAVNVIVEPRLGWTSTVTEPWPLTAGALAPIVAVPSATAVSRPLDDTVATEGAVVVHVTPVTVVPSSACAVSWLVRPTLRIVWPAMLRIVAGVETDGVVGAVAGCPLDPQPTSAAALRHTRSARQAITVR